MNIDTDKTIREIQQQETLDNLYNYFDTVLKPLKFNAFTLGIALLHKGKVDSTGAHLYSNASQEFQEKYHQIEGPSFDPIFELMAQRYLPYTKSSTLELFKQSPQKQQIIDIDQEYYLGDALMIPVSTADYCRGVVMFTPDHIDENNSSIWHNRFTLHLIAIYMMAQAQQLGFGQTLKKKVALTARETECLQLSAQGHTGNNIAKLLGISERTTRFHIQNACKKLGKNRRAEAIASALHQGLIRI